jgi:sporulation protein YlmC with PRC-barrel domain
MVGLVVTFSVFKINGSYAGWLTPIILVIQEAEIKRIMVRSHPQTNNS